MASAAKNTALTVADKLALYREQMKIEQAPAWRPAPDSTVVGEVIGYRVGTTTEYGDYPVIVFKDVESGEPFAFHAFHTIAREWVATTKPPMGSVWAMTYNGERTANKVKADGETTEYHLYHFADFDEIGTTKEQVIPF